MDWRPISTAPHDGTPFVFVHSDGSGAAVVFWWDPGDDNAGFYDLELDWTHSGEDFDSWVPLSSGLEEGARHWIKLALGEGTKKPAEA